MLLLYPKKHSVSMEKVDKVTEGFVCFVIRVLEK